MRTFVIYDEEDVPFVGHTGLTFTFYSLIDGTVIDPGEYPAITAVGAGRYGFEPIANTGWVVINTNMASPEYIGMWFDESVTGFMLFDEFGIPLAGALAGITISQYLNAAGTPVDPPTLLEKGGGWYAFTKTWGTQYIVTTGAIPGYYTEERAGIAPIIGSAFNTGWN